MKSSDALLQLAPRVHAFISRHSTLDTHSMETLEQGFEQLALDLFAVQFELNPPYQRFCAARGAMSGDLKHWTQIPPVPTSAFKELDLSCIAAEERTSVFHSSGTSGRQPSRHFHSEASLRLYEASLWPWFKAHLVDGLPSPKRLIVLTPSPTQAPHSSLAYMFDSVWKRLSQTPDPRETPYSKNLVGQVPRKPQASSSSLVNATESGKSADSDHPTLDTRHSGNRVRPAAAQTETFYGVLDADGHWSLDFNAVTSALKEAEARNEVTIVLGTAFLFVHLLDHLAARGLRFRLPTGSRVLETGGYKGRSRNVPKADLHRLLTRHLAIAPECIVTEYGMSELSSQAYARPQTTGHGPKDEGHRPEHGTMPLDTRHSAHGTRNTHHAPHRTDVPAQPSNPPAQFSFPPWARVQIISPETGNEVREGEIGLIRVFDLANVYSVMAIQTEDLAVRRGTGFELIGRAEGVEPRGCSLQTE